MQPKKKTTECIDCNKIIEYKTNKPKRCTECKENRARKKGKANRKNNKKSSYAQWSKEYTMFQILDELMPEELYVRNGYYSFLISPKGEPMQLDIYYPERKLAFE